MKKILSPTTKYFSLTLALLASNCKHVDSESLLSNKIHSNQAFLGSTNIESRYNEALPLNFTYPKPKLFEENRSVIIDQVPLSIPLIRVRTAQILLYDRNLITYDFPFLKGASSQAIKNWLLEQNAYVSYYYFKSIKERVKRFDKSVPVDFIPTNNNQTPANRTGIRLKEYNRALLLEAITPNKRKNAPNDFSLYFDTKGLGLILDGHTVFGLRPAGDVKNLRSASELKGKGIYHYTFESNHDVHSTGALPTSLAIQEFVMEKAISRITSGINKSRKIIKELKSIDSLNDIHLKTEDTTQKVEALRTVGFYAVGDFGFNVINVDKVRCMEEKKSEEKCPGPDYVRAGFVIRRGNIRDPEFLGFAPPQKRKSFGQYTQGHCVAMEFTLRKWGITTVELLRDWEKNGSFQDCPKNERIIQFASPKLKNCLPMNCQLTTNHELVDIGSVRIFDQFDLPTYFADRSDQTVRMWEPQNPNSPKTEEDLLINIDKWGVFKEPSTGQIHFRLRDVFQKILRDRKTCPIWDQSWEERFQVNFTSDMLEEDKTRLRIYSEQMANCGEKILIKMKELLSEIHPAKSKYFNYNFDYKK